VADPAREARRSGRSALPMDRQGAPAAVAEDRCARHRFEREPTYGEQEGSAYNGHFGCTCYHPLFVFNQLGDVERCALRPGNLHCADGWRAVLEPVIARYRGTEERRYFRGDAAFASPEIYEFLKTEGMGYAIRLPANRVLQDRIGYLLRRPVERPPHEVRRFYASFRYQAQSWNKPRRVVAKVEWDPGELYPPVGFSVTNLARRAERIVAFYNQRGTAEQWKEGKGAIKWTRLSYRTFAANALQLHAPRLQPRQFHANAGDAQDRRAVVADQLAREADQDRRQGGQSRPLRPSSWPRSRCRGRCLRTFCRRSPGCERLPRQHEERCVKVQHTTTAEVCR
jgi:hypothetical protein